MAVSRRGGWTPREPMDPGAGRPPMDAPYFGNAPRLLIRAGPSAEMRRIDGQAGTVPNHPRPDRAATRRSLPLWNLESKIRAQGQPPGSTPRINPQNHPPGSSCSVGTWTELRSAEPEEAARQALAVIAHETKSGGRFSVDREDVSSEMSAIKLVDEDAIKIFEGSRASRECRRLASARRSGFVNRRGWFGAACHSWVD